MYFLYLLLKNFNVIFLVCFWKRKKKKKPINKFGLQFGSFQRDEVCSTKSEEKTHYERRLIKNRVIRFVKVSVMKDNSRMGKKEREREIERKKETTTSKTLLRLDKLVDKKATTRTTNATGKVMTKSCIW